MSDTSGPDERRMRLRYPGTCRVCGAALPAHAEAIYERGTRTVRCCVHEAAPASPSGTTVEAGTPGAFARREFDRRRARREERIRKAHPKLSGLIHALTEDPQSTRAWDAGAVGEERLGARLNGLATDQLRVLHDRRIPGSRSNIDHLAVTATGVWVIDAKRYRGRPRLQVDSGFLRPRAEKPFVGTRNCTPVVDGVLRQVAVVREQLDDSTPVHGVLCFLDADWPLVGGSFTVRGVEVLWPKKLYPKLRAAGSIAPAMVEATHQSLAGTFGPA